MDIQRLLRIKNIKKLKYHYIKKLPNEFYIINPISPLPLTVGPISKYDIKYFRETLNGGTTERQIEKLASVFNRNKFSCKEIDEYLQNTHGEKYKAKLNTFLKLLIDTYTAGDWTLRVIENYIDHKKLDSANDTSSKKPVSLYNKIKKKIDDIRFNYFINSSETKEFLRYLENYVGATKEKDYTYKFYIISKGCSRECVKNLILEGVKELPKNLPPFFPGCVCELHFSLGKPKFRKEQEQTLNKWYSSLE